MNVFTVEPENPQELVEEMERGMSRLPGYVSADIHASFDGTKVTNYARWRSVEDFEAAMQNPDAQPHMQTAAQLAGSSEPTLYEVVYTHEIG